MTRSRLIAQLNDCGRWNRLEDMASQSATHRIGRHLLRITEVIIVKVTNSTFSRILCRVFQGGLF